MRLVALLLAFTLAQSTDKPAPVALPHDWAVGTRYHVELVKTREDVEGEEPPKVSSTRTPFDVEVLARRDDGYRVRWTFGRPDAAPEATMSSALEQKIAGLVEGLVMEFDTDATGSVTKLVDGPAMEAHFEAAASKLLAQMQDAHAAPEEVRAVRAAAASLKGPGLLSSWLQLPTRFYMPSGAALILGEKRTYEDHLPNPFGGDPLPAQSSLSLREVRADKHEAVVEWRTSIDATKAAPILEASMRAYAARVGQELPPGKPLTFDAIEDAATYVYDLATGIPRSVVITRTTVMAGTRRTDTQRYDVTLPEKK
jgi:hypothetical protein